MSEAKRLLPIFPLPLVLFPGMLLPLHIFEPRYQVMMADIMDGDREFGVTLFMETVVENVGVTTAVGTIARVTDLEPLEEGKMNIETEGIRRFKITEVDADSKPYLQGYIEWLDDRPETEPDSAFIREISDVFLDMLRLNEKVQKKDRQFELEGGLSPEELSFLIAEYLNHDVSLQQLLLEMTSTRERLEKEQQTIGQIAQRLAAMSQIEAAFERSE